MARKGQRRGDLKLSRYDFVVSGTHYHSTAGARPSRVHNLSTAPRFSRSSTRHEISNDYSHIKIIPRAKVPSITSSDDFTFTTPSIHSMDKPDMHQITMSRHPEQTTPPYFASTISEAETSAIFNDVNFLPADVLPANVLPTNAPPISGSALAKFKLSNQKPAMGPDKPGRIRTVMYDPMKSPSPIPLPRTFHQSPSLLNTPRNRPLTPFYPVWSSENELIATSEPLPWRERPVQIIDAPLPFLSEGNGLASITRSPLGVLGNKISSPERFSQTKTGHESLSMRDLSLLDATTWWIFDYRAPIHRSIMIHLGGMASTTQTPQTPNEMRIRQQNHMLFAPLLANLEEYLQPAHQQIGQFGSWAPCPEWSVDTSNDGLRSFFGEDWGAPPPRVGRDPRYRNPDGGRGPFEETWNRLGRDRRSRW